MRKTNLLILGFLALNLFWSAHAATFKNVEADVYFSPNGGAEDAIVKSISEAKKEILVQAFLFSNKSITEALIAAHKRGVAVKVIVDKAMERHRHNTVPELLKARIPTFIDNKHRTAHNKVMILDTSTVITGSFNFIKSAETSNAENLLVIRSVAMAKTYKENWETHLSHSIRATKEMIVPSKPRKKMSDDRVKEGKNKPKNQV